ADQGCLAEAAQHCEDHIRTEPPSAAVFYLLGVIREATEACAAAAEAYRKALYLDPNHYEALVHLALFHERQGDAAGARTLNERARRQAEGRRAGPPRGRVAAEPGMPAARPDGAAMMPALVVDDCWNRIGVRGDASCPELKHHVHCRNCP